MGEGEDPDRFRSDQVDNVIGESLQGDPPDWKVSRNFRHRGTALRESGDPFQNIVNGGEKIAPQSGAPFLIPMDGFPRAPGPPLFLCGSACSLLRQARCEAGADHGPVGAGRLPREHSKSAALDLQSPGVFNAFIRDLIQGGEELGGDIGSFFGRKLQGFMKNTLCLAGHDWIVPPAVSPEPAPP